MFVLTLLDSLCCAGFVYPIFCWCMCPWIGTRSIDWTQFSRFLLKTKTGSSLRNAVSFEQKHDYWQCPDAPIVLIHHRHKLMSSFFCNLYYGSAVLETETYIKTPFLPHFYAQ
jgi:hypothetical protein